MEEVVAVQLCDGIRGPEVFLADYAAAAVIARLETGGVVAGDRMDGEQ